MRSQILKGEKFFGIIIFLVLAAGAGYLIYDSLFGLRAQLNSLERAISEQDFVRAYEVMANLPSKNPTQEMFRLADILRVASFQKAITLLAQRKMKDSLYLFHRIKLHFTNFIEVNSYLGIIYEAMGQKKKAIEYYHELAQKRPDLAGEKLVPHLLELQSEGDQTKSKRALEAKTKGNKYFYKKEYYKAIEYYKKALLLDTNYAEVYNNLGASYYFLKEFDKMAPYYEKTVELDPGNNPDVFLILGDTYEKSGKKAKALKYFELFIHFHPQDERNKSVQFRIQKLKE